MNKNNSDKNPDSKNSKSVGIVFYTIVIFIVAFLAGNFFNNVVYPRFLTPSWEKISVPKTVDKDLPFNLIWEVWETAQENYVEQPVSDKDLFYGSLSGIIKSLDDPYSNFFSPEDADFFLDTMSGDFEGVGIEITIKDNYLTVISPLPETPAKRAGMKSGDKIMAIDGKDTFDMSLDEAAHFIRGPKGEPVTLNVLHKGADSAEEIEIVRDTIEIETVSWEMKNEEIAYINITHFSGDTWQDFKNIAKVVKNSNPKGIILNLRNNPGGYLGTAVDIAGFWLGQDVVTVAKDADDKEEEYRCYGNGQFGQIPTVVLVNAGSASASEIISGAMQDYELGLVLGEKTFGKGSVQELEEFSDGSAAKITVAHWYTPKGRSIEKNGILPDVEVEIKEADLSGENDKEKNDPQVSRAVEILQNKDKYQELIEKETKKAKNEDQVNNDQVDNDKNSDSK